MNPISICKIEYPKYINIDYTIMDIRDIKEEPEIVENGKFLEKIYELQKVLLDHYIGIEGLPQYPVDVNTKSSQVLLKDFTGRVTEELAEGYESHILVHEMIQKVGMNLDLMDTETYDQMISHLQNLNEEQADAIHFMVELLIYANIQPEDIKSWVIKKWKETYPISYTQVDTKCQDIIHLSMQLGMLDIRDYYENDLNSQKVYLLDESLTEEQIQYLPGGRVYSWDLVDNSRKVLWDVTYALNISRNCLKNKPWKQSGVMTNESLYQSKLVEAFVYMMGYYALLGMDSSQIYYLYFKKNKVNQFRIASKY